MAPVMALIMYDCLPSLSRALSRTTSKVGKEGYLLEGTAAGTCRCETPAEPGLDLLLAWDRGASATGSPGPRSPRFPVAETFSASGSSSRSGHLMLRFRFFFSSWEWGVAQ